MPFLQSGLCEIARHLISCIGINPGDSALSPIPADLTSTQPGTSYLCQATSKFRSRHTLSGTRYLNTNNFYLTLNPSLITLAVYKTKVFKIKTSCSTEKKSYSWPEELAESAYKKCQRGHNNSFMPLFLIPTKKSTKTCSCHKLGQKEMSRRNNSYKKLL